MNHDLIAIEKFAQLRQLCWQMRDDAKIEAHDALRIYERNWDHVQQDLMSPEEKELLARLIREYGNGIFLV